MWVVCKEGVTQRQAQKFELDQQQRDLGNALSVLDVLRNGSDQEAAETLVRLRLGQTVEAASKASARERARRRAPIATPDTPSVAGSSQKSGTGSQRQGSHFGGGSASVSEPADSPLHASRSLTNELRSHLHAESDRQRSQASACDARLSSWSFTDTPETVISPADWDYATTRELEQSDFLMDGIFAQYGFGGGDGDNNPPTSCNNDGMFAM